MTHQYTLTTDTGASLSTLNDALSATTFTRVLTDRDQTFSTRETIDGQEEHWAVVYAADTELRSDVVAELETVVSDYTTATITHRHTWQEYGDTKTADASYYPVDFDKGHRTPPTVDHTDGFEVALSADYHISGTEYSEQTTHTFAQPTQYARRDRVIADESGVSVLAGQEFDKPTDTTPPDAPQTPTGAVSLGLVTVKNHIDRIPYGGIQSAEFAAGPSETTTVYEK